MIIPEEILTPDQLAQRLQVSRAWVFEKTRQRQRNPIPCMRIGKYLRFSWPAVSAWLESVSTPVPEVRRGR